MQHLQYILKNAGAKNTSLQIGNVALIAQAFRSSVLYLTSNQPSHQQII